MPPLVEFSIFIRKNIIKDKDKDIDNMIVTTRKGKTGKLLYFYNMKPAAKKCLYEEIRDEFNKFDRACIVVNSRGKIMILSLLTMKFKS